MGFPNYFSNPARAVTPKSITTPHKTPFRLPWEVQPTGIGATLASAAFNAPAAAAIGGLAGGPALALQLAPKARFGQRNPNAQPPGRILPDAENEQWNAVGRQFAAGGNEIQVPGYRGIVEPPKQAPFTQSSYSPNAYGLLSDKGGERPAPNTSFTPYSDRVGIESPSISSVRDVAGTTNQAMQGLRAPRTQPTAATVREEQFPEASQPSAMPEWQQSLSRLPKNPFAAGKLGDVEQAAFAKYYQRAQEAFARENQGGQYASFEDWFDRTNAMDKIRAHLTKGNGGDLGKQFVAMSPVDRRLNEFRNQQEVLKAKWKAEGRA